MHTMKLKTIKIENTAFYGIAIPYDQQLIEKAKQLRGRWNPRLQLWLFPQTKAMYQTLTNAFRISHSTLNPNKRKVPKAYLDQLERRRYSLNTIQTYVSLFERFLEHFNNIAPKKANRYACSTIPNLFSQRKEGIN